MGFLTICSSTLDLTHWLFDTVKRREKTLIGIGAHCLCPAETMLVYHLGTSGAKGTKEDGNPINNGEFKHLG